MTSSLGGQDKDGRTGEHGREAVGSRPADPPATSTGRRPLPGAPGGRPGGDPPESPPGGR